jgi:hypothetical protein
MKRSLAGLALLLIVALIVAGCGAATALEGVRSDTTTKGGIAAPAPIPASVPAMAEKPASPAAAAGDSLSSPSVESAVSPDRLIIRTGTMTIIVVDVQDAADKVAAIANGAGGLVVSTDSHHEGDMLYATVTIKVPAEAFDNVMSDLRKLAVKVDSENSSTQDVTEQYVDLDARVKVLQETEQQLMTFLDQTKNVDETLKVYNELTNVRSQIDSIQGRINYLQKSAAMSTITVQVRPQESTAIVQETGWSPMKVVRSVLRWLVSALEFLFYAMVFLVFGLLPVLILLAIPVLIVRAIWRRLRRPKAA